MNLIFAGSSDFGLPALGRLVEHGFPLLVVSQPDKPAGRSLRPQACPVAEYARKQGLPLFQPEDVNSPDSLDRIREFQPALLITASYGGLLKRELRQIPPLGAINLHPSLLPLYRGATPIQSCLLNGNERTGVSIFRLNARLDAGPILGQVETSIGPKENFTTLHDRLAGLAAELLLELLPGLLAGRIEAVPQDDRLATHTKKIEKADLLIDWSLPARQVLNRVRAFSLTPGACSSIQSRPLKILSASVLDDPSQGAPGSIAALLKNTGFSVNCSDRQLLIRQVQPAGRKAMDAWAFQLGARLRPGDAFADPHAQILHPRLEEQ